MSTVSHIDRWLYWNVDNIHVTILSRNAAAYTMNFEYAFIEQGERRDAHGSWTYVFRRHPSGVWQAVVSNGMHVPIN